MKKLLYIIAFTSVVILSGCASGSKYTELQSSIPELSAEGDQGRIFFSRTNSMFGGGMQPKIKLNGEFVGKSQPGGFFFIDHKAGDVQVSTTIGMGKNVNFTLAPGEMRYVKTKAGIGAFIGQIYPELIDNEIAEKEIVEGRYIGDMSLINNNPTSTSIAE